MLKKIKRILKPKPFYMKDNKKYKHFEIGDYTYGKPNIQGYDGRATFKIGRFCSIASNVTIFLGIEHRTDWITTYPFVEFPECCKSGVNKSKGDVTIGNDVWVGDGALILSGVSIGNGAVIGARAVVTKDVKPYEIVAGNPARHIRFRFDEETIAGLTKIRWWDWPIEKIKAESDTILSENTAEFITKNL